MLEPLLIKHSRSRTAQRRERLSSSTMARSTSEAEKFLPASGDNVDVVQLNSCAYYFTDQKASSLQYLERNEPPSRFVRSQIIILIISCSLGISYGMSTGHSAVLLPQIQSTNGSIEIDEDTGSWIASMYAIMVPVGCLFGGVTMDLWGRRSISIIANIGMIVGWVVIAAAPGAAMILVGRSVEGLAKGLATTAVMVLKEELSDSTFRASTLCAGNLFRTIGIFTVSSLGALVHWRTASGIAGGLSVISLIHFFFVPESPIWLVRKTRMGEAESALKWIWGPGREEQAKEELQSLAIRYQPQGHSSKEKGKRTNITKKLQDFSQFCRSFLIPSTLKPFLISHFFSTIQDFCGLFLLTYYSIDIIERLKRNESHGPDEYLGNVLLSAIRVVATGASVFLMFRVGRRPMTMISGLGSTVSALTLSVILFVQTTGDSYPIPTHIEVWVNFSLILIFCGSSTMGFFTVPSIMLGEMQPAHTRSFVCGYIFTVNDIILAAAVKSYPLLVHNLGMRGLFLLFGMSCLVCTLFAYLFLPETKDKTLLEIEDYFKQPNVLWITRKKYISNNNVNIHPLPHA